MMVASQCVVLLLLTAVAASTNFGPFEISIQDITKCDEEGNGDITIENFKVRMSDKRTAVVSVDVTSKVVIDRNITMEAVIFTMRDGKYDPKPIRFPVGPVCDAIEKFFPKSYKKLYKKVGIDGCPVQPATWNVKKFPLDIDIPVPQLPYMKFKIDSVLYHERDRLACVRFTLAIVPEGTVKYSKY